MALTNHIVPDSPTNNFATMNPLAYRYGHNGIQYSNGNLRVVQGTSAITYATFTTKSGKWYWEIFIENNGTVVNSDYRGLAEPVLGQSSDGWGNDCFLYNSYNGTYKIDAGSFTASDIGTANNPDIIGFFWDADNGYMTVSVNGVSGTTITGLSTGIPMCPAVACNYDTIDIINFGQDPTFAGNKNTPATVNINGTNVTGPFAPSGDAAGTAGLFYYPPPAGAKALCTANLPDFTPTVNNDTPQDYFKAVIWTNATTDTNVTVNLPFQADMIWWKQRDFANSHRLIDSVRGLTSELTTNSATQESIIDPATRDYNVTSINSDNFTFNGYVNTSTRGASMVGWCWKAGGAPTADNSNTSGAMTANSVSLNGTLQSNYTPAGSPTIYPKRMSINTDAGFSIVKYYGNNATNSNQSIPSGLSSLDFVIIKDLDDTEYWFVYHKSLSTNHNLYLQLPNTQTNVSTSGGGGIKNPLTDGNIVPLLGNINTTNINDTHNFIAYCWHSVEGYSKFGSYTGNGSPDGPFVYTGFRPAWVMVKNISTSGSGTSFSNWSIFDSARPPYNTNPANNRLEADTALAEDGDGKTGSGGNGIDMLSNGFKLRAGDWYETNHSSSTYIYAAFAEQPFKYANAR